MSKRFIASIFPMERFEQRPPWQPDGIFRLPAVGRGEKPALLAVDDRICPEYIGNGVTQPRTILGEEIAPDLVGIWTNLQYASGDAKPGIWLVDIPGVSEPTVEDVLASQQYAAALESQNKFFAFLVNQGDEYAAQDKRNQILLINRIAVSWLGMVRDWAEEFKSENLKACQFCQKNINSRAMKCPHCSEIVDYAAYAAQQKLKEEALRAAKTITPPLRPTEPKQAVA